MAEDKTQHTPLLQENASKDAQGRVHNSQNPALEKQETGNDISQVDQQEGDMERGESGGNFNQPSDKKN